ncbi:MAG: hypothetical protein ACRD9L_28660, partial [Bryobacteraceae bacterium]
MRRSDFGLADVFGARFDGAVDARVQNSYVWLEHPHPLLKGLEDTPRIIAGASRVHTISAGSEHSPLTLVPSYPDLPMEDVYPRVPRTNIPMAHIRESGGGRVVYFPWDIARTFWEVLAGDHLKLLRNAVTWVTGEEPAATVTGPGVVDLTVWRQRDSMTVHVVN